MVRKERSSFMAKVIRLGRITIPHQIRHYLEISDGDLVEVEVKKIQQRRDEDEGEGEKP
ncbi:MAG: AbrB/MazE/SpoVT family DNA-binding domain-containing protein [Candidatus Bathyarchaeia archaeon]